MSVKNEMDEVQSLAAETQETLRLTELFLAAVRGRNVLRKITPRQDTLPMALSTDDVAVKTGT